MTVSIRDVATLAGVSVGTVSNVLNRPDAVSAASVERVNSAIETLGYVRNDAARQLRAGISTTVGFVALDGRNPFFADVVAGAENEATSRGLALLHGNSDEDAARESLYIDLFEQQMVRGLLIAPFGDVTARLRRLRARGIPSVLIDRFSGDGSVSSVSVDSVAGGRLAAEHLLERGRRRIAFVGGGFDIRQVTDRLAGARSAVDNSEHAATLEVVPTHAMTVEEGVSAGRRLLARERRDRPDAVFAANDLLALGLLQSLVVDGRMLVPHEIAVVGFDDISFAAAAAVPLTSVRQPSALIGGTAMRILLDEALDPDRPTRQTVFSPQLIARASTSVETL
ncbi:LacI family transcriptional regulator [Microbacterium testaceum]|uniref:LacI family DNA-binding transcriptional regulator n=1 Tax=Microbacterium TaxID=33882 RepID=UPI00277FDA27|nr:LacI family DNA-binding transcriptional regulator [Microbacterium testaceum]MDQ1171847.1 LacI family transcriptional regulator [Microbacterium testaceum]